MRPAENIAKPLPRRRRARSRRSVPAFTSKGVVRPNLFLICLARPVARRHLLTLVALGAFAGVSLCTSAAAFAEEARPGWEVFGRFSPTELHPGGYGLLSVYVFNSGGGGVSGSATLVDELPAGLEAVSEIPEDPEAEQEATTESGECSGSPVVRCEVSNAQPVGHPALFNIPVRVSSGMQPTSSLVDLMSVSGGGALGEGKGSVPVVVGAGTAGFGFSGFDGWLSNLDGTTDTQAGSHPYSLSIAFSPNSVGVGAGKERPADEAHALNVNLPPGLVGEPSAVPECTRQQFDGEECPPTTQVGVDYPAMNGPSFLSFGIYNLVPPPGVAAQFGFTFLAQSTFLDSNVRSGGDNGITTHINPLPQRGVVFNVATIWGYPGKVQNEQNDEPKSVSQLGGRGRAAVVDVADVVSGPAAVRDRSARSVARRKRGRARERPTVQGAGERYDAQQRR